jgi:hypothetical protein
MKEVYHNRTICANFSKIRLVESVDMSDLGCKKSRTGQKNVKYSRYYPQIGRVFASAPSFFATRSEISTDPRKNPQLPHPTVFYIICS